MKYILASLFLICALSCKKEDKATNQNLKCYRCEVQKDIYMVGNTVTKDTCVSPGTTPTFKDVQGNSLTSVCVEK